MSELPPRMRGNWTTEVSHPYRERMQKERYFRTLDDMLQRLKPYARLTGCASVLDSINRAMDSQAKEFSAWIEEKED